VTALDAPDVAPQSTPNPPDHRDSWLPTWSMVTTRFMDLRHRRGLMIALILVTVGLPVAFLAVRIVLHLAAPITYGPAGGYDMYVGMTVGVLYLFGFIVAAAVGATAGSADLSEGVFRHLVITGRSRLALYLARIPAGLAIVLPMVAIGFAIVCIVSVAAAPTTFTYNGAAVPAGLSRTELVAWAKANPETVICNFGATIPTSPPVGCVRDQGPQPKLVMRGPSGAPTTVTTEQAQAAAEQIANSAYSDYASQFRAPPLNLMLKTGLWLELEATIGLVVGLGLGSLLGQRTVAVILMIALELIITPIARRAQIPHFINVQRGIIGVAMAHLEPGHLPSAGGGGGSDYLVTETTTVAVLVVVVWLVVWTVIGAWRMVTRDA
jgi:hypothetical protein